MRKLLSLLLFATLTLSVSAAELNIYASGLRNEAADAQKHVQISYYLNAPATALTFQLIDANHLVAKSVSITDATALTKGQHSIDVNLEAAADGVYTWALQAEANATTALTQVLSGDATSKFYMYSPRGMAVNCYPETDNFGYVYVSNAVASSGKQTKGIFVYDNKMNLLNTNGNGYMSADWPTAAGTGGTTPYIATPYRVAVAEDGEVYISGGQDNGKGVWKMSTDATPSFTKVCTTGLYGIAVKGTGADRKLYGIENALHLRSYNVGGELPFTTTGTLVASKDNMGMTQQASCIYPDPFGGWWVSQYRYTDTNANAIVFHINASGTKDCTAYGVTGCTLQNVVRGTMGVNKDATLLATYTGSQVKLFSVAYDANHKPTLTYIGTTANIGTNIDGLAFDYADNLYITSSSSERVYVYATKKANNTCTTPAASSRTITLKTVKPVAHIFAYELNRTLNGDELGYTFTFKANMAATAGAVVFYQEGSEVGRVALTSVMKGDNSISIAKADMPQVEGVMTWGVELSAAANEVFGPVYTGEARFARGHAVVDASPESNYFGRIYVADRRTTAANGGLYVYQPDYTKVNTTAYKLGRTASNYSRPAIDAEGTLYLGDYADATSGVYVVNPADLTTCTQLYEGTRAQSGLFSKNSVAVGGSIAGLAIYGEGANTMLYSSQEDMTPGNVIVGYRLGQTDGTIAHSWGVAPTVNYSSVVSKSTTNQGGNNAIVATDKGLWVSQNRNTDNGTTTRNLIFISNAGTVTYTSTGSSFNGCLGGGVAVNKTNDRLYIVGAQGESVLKEYSITWAGNTPTLTLLHTYAWGYDAASTLHFDYAGNLVACVGTSYGGTDANVMRLVVFSTPTENNTTLVPAKKALTVESTTHVDVTSVTINETDQTLEKGLTTTLTATVLPANATDPTITWESDNTSVATVSPEGLVLAVNAGEAHITATADGVSSEPVTITVFKAEFDVTWEPNGATVKMVAPAGNVDLWNQFMPAYNAYYTARGYGQRASQPITAVRVFLNNKIKDFMTDEDSPWKWLGDYILSVATAGGRTLDTDLKWSYDVMAFFNASAAAGGGYGNADFTTAGQVATWLPLWKEANNYLPLTLRATDAIPAIHKENATFEGWYDNATLTGDAVTSVTHDITLYAKWRNSLTLKDTETTTTLLTTYEGQVADVVVKRNFVAGTGWYTLSLPFSLDAAQTAAVFGSGAEFATLSDAYNKTGDMMYLQFDYVDALEAGVPYLFMPAMDMTEIAVEGVTIDPTLRPVLTSLADFRGLFQRTTFTGEAGSPIYFMGEENMLVQLGVNNFTSNAYRCYFRLDPSIAALNTRARVVFGPQVATDMEQIGSEDEVQKVLKNGQIYILKNGHTYTTTGMLVE